MPTLLGSWWDSPVDIEVGRATLYHLREALRWWRQASLEDVPLLSKVTRLTVTTDASLSGQGFVMEDQNGDVVASESKLASEVMNVASWGCNRREMHAL